MSDQRTFLGGRYLLRKLVTDSQPSYLLTSGFLGQTKEFEIAVPANFFRFDQTESGDYGLAATAIPLGQACISSFLSFGRYAQRFRQMYFDQAAELLGAVLPLSDRYGRPSTFDFKSLTPYARTNFREVIISLKENIENSVE
ncbi:hypothetical protein [Gordonia polyisoprenivorans]|uniref:Uncharacterized protein n=1 Tax=Gordonia polyisoprenivorans TaxID=84595 RepID=A0A846WI98_9ACTN|nr:hypothetical protein [Gordonia polyisoprenivorans]NKY00600.1 hypothetical protein [Gordonia polyisoprenivorans]